jgi:four helix bundle protein
MENKPHDLKLRTKAYARRIIHLYTSLPKETVAQVLGKQLLRSGTSVGANYREANRGRSKAEFICKMGDSLKELEETEYWIELLVDEGIVRPAKTEPLLGETRELMAIFITIINKSRRK